MKLQNISILKPIFYTFITAISIQAQSIYFFDWYGCHRDLHLDPDELKHDYVEQVAPIIAGITVVTDTPPELVNDRITEVVNLLVDPEHEQSVLEISTRAKLIVGDILYDIATEVTEWTV